MRANTNSLYIIYKPYQRYISPNHHSRSYILKNILHQATSKSFSTSLHRHHPSPKVHQNHPWPIYTNIILHQSYILKTTHHQATSKPPFTKLHQNGPSPKVPQNHPSPKLHQNHPSQSYIRIILHQSYIKIILHKATSESFFTKATSKSFLAKATSSKSSLTNLRQYYPSPKPHLHNHLSPNYIKIILYQATSNSS